MGQILRKLTSLVAPRKRTSHSPEVEATFRETVEKVIPFTMTSVSRIIALCDAVRYLTLGRVPGAIVECGVWRGGSMMAAADVLLQKGDLQREIYLYDTFAGMSPPTDVDVAMDGQSAEQLLKQQERDDPNSVWCVAALEDVKRNLASTGYPLERMHFIAGTVENTLPETAPDEIALLRLDTDWYESTRHELEHLFPRLVPGGVLIIDDYGHWQGSRKAVDEYFAKRGIPMLLSRIDYTGRMGVYYPKLLAESEDERSKEAA